MTLAAEYLSSIFKKFRQHKCLRNLLVSIFVHPGLLPLSLNFKFQAGYSFSSGAAAAGAKAMEVCRGNPQTQLALASGINNIPEAGIILIQQPGRLGESVVNLLDWLGWRLSQVGLVALKKRLSPHPERLPQL
jgi:hypothetical protein